MHACHVDKLYLQAKKKIKQKLSKSIKLEYKKRNCKGIVLSDVFNVINEIDCLVHLQEISYSRVSHPEEIFTIGDKHDLLVISVDKAYK